MKEIKKENITYTIIYEAVDGTQFYTEEECAEYEKSAAGVLWTRIEKLIVDRKNEYELFHAGCEYNDVLALKIESQKDIDTIMQLFYIQHPYYLNNKDAHARDVYKKYADEYAEMLNTALNQNDLFLLGMNYEKEIYFIDTRNNIKNKLVMLGRTDEPKK